MSDYKGPTATAYPTGVSVSFEAVSHNLTLAEARALRDQLTAIVEKPRFTAELIEEARGWISECVWRELEPEDIAALSATRIYRGVSKHYDGGWDQFVADGA